MYRLLNMTPVHVSRARGPGLVFVVLCAVASAFSHGAAALRVVPMTPFVENNSTLGLLLAAKPVHTSANRRSLQSVTCTAGYPVTCSSGLGCCTLTYPVCCTGAKAGYCGLNAASCATSSTNYAAYSSDTVTCPNTLFYSCPKATPTCCKSYGNYVGCCADTCTTDANGNANGYCTSPTAAAISTAAIIGVRIYIGLPMIVPMCMDASDST